MSLDTSAFFAETFDVDAWITEQVGPVPREIVLEQLRNELGRCQADLKAELVSTVNRDYAGFVQLSSKMDTFNEAVIRFKPALSHVHDRLQTVAITVDDRLRRLKTLVRDRDTVREAKSVLLDYVRGDELIGKIESVLRQTEVPEGESGGEDVGTIASRYLRLANWFQHLGALQSKHATLPFFTLLAPRVKAARSAFDMRLRSTFVSLIRSSDAVGSASALEHCLQAFVAAGSGNFAESVILSEVTSPFLCDNFTAGRMDAGGSRGSFAGLPALATATLEFVRDRCVPLATACAASGGAIDVFGNCVWKPCLDAMTNEAPEIFTCTDAATFHTVYDTMSKFFEGLCGIASAVSPAIETALRGHPSATALAAKWKSRALPVYFGLRFQELTFGLTADCKQQATKHSTPLPLSHTSSFVHLQASVSLWNGLVRCWSSDVFIGSLVQSFASATGQMIGMYADWVQRTVAEATTRFASDVCAAAIADCTTLSAAVTSELLQLASAASPANRSALSELLQGSSKQLRDAATASLTKLVALLTSACTPALASVETITSLYWMRKGVPAPTKACQFVPRFLKPLQEFLATDAGVLTESWHRHTLVVDVLSAVTGQYSAAISALIAKRENLESGLGWLNKAKQGGAAGAEATAMSDADKINLQAHLDVKLFVEMASEIGSGCVPPVTPDEIPELAELIAKSSLSPKVA